MLRRFFDWFRFDARVERGAALLDQRGPSGWRDRVDLARLDMQEPDDCVLGQLCGWRNSGLSPWKIWSCGFAQFVGTDHLTPRWRREIIVGRAIDLIAKHHASLSVAA